MKKYLLIGVMFCLCIAPAYASPPDSQQDQFRQLEEILPTPGDYRLASGAPGPRYWQQRADYDIRVSLNDAEQSLKGSGTIIYHNRSPHTLPYLWVQLDQNVRKPDATRYLVQPAPEEAKESFNSFRQRLMRHKFSGGFNISAVMAQGQKLPHTIVDTMMRIDLSEPLSPGDSFEFSIDWGYQIQEQQVLGGRTGYEYFDDDDNRIYEIAQWFPRMAAYDDTNGWQNKQFLGRGEFALEFGDYRVSIDAPRGFVVTATGELQNTDEVLTSQWRSRLQQAREADKPVFIITPDEARKNQSTRRSGRQTWVFEAKNVRDFAFAASRKFIWDALGVDVDGRKVMAMSFYPNEAEPLWSQYSTRSVAHTLDVYGEHAFPYPYPVAISVNGPVYGMEYPMLSFNGAKDTRPEIEDGEVTYSDRDKYGLISVIIHEVGHNWYPMIVNSDERQWTWMDEGMNTFLQFLTEQKWEEDYPSRRGHARDITEFMSDPHQVPIMTNSESLVQFGNNAYAKPATALNILRETLLGRDLFDFAFRTYSQRWMFKRPTPADFFRSMEDASGVDLDWFWRGWFYSDEYVDIALERIQSWRVDTINPEIERAWERQQEEDEPEAITTRRNRSEGIALLVEQYPGLLDYYNQHDQHTVTRKDRDKYTEALEELEPWQQKLLEQKETAYIFEFANLGGVAMPIPLQLEWSDGSEQRMVLPAEIWRFNQEKTAWMLLDDRKLISAEVDPDWEIADHNSYNNKFPREIEPGRLELEKRPERGRNLIKENLEE